MTISTTPLLALPWPNSDEPVTNGWDAIRDLAVALDTYLGNTGLADAGNPEIHSNTSLWPVGDFASGDTFLAHVTRGGMVEVWGQGNLSTNGPQFPGAGGVASPTYIRMPVAPTDLRAKQVVGEWVYSDSSSNPIGGGALYYFPSHVAGEHWARCDANLTTGFQQAMSFHMRYPLDMP